MRFRRLTLVGLSIGFVACTEKATTATKLPVTPVTRADIAVRVTATGVLEPINPVDVKSKAQGTVTDLPVETGSIVKKGQLIAQVDPRDVKNAFDQAMGDDLVSTAALNQAIKEGVRKDALFAQHVITVSQHDSSGSAVISARSNLQNARSALDLARQKLEDATVEAPISGTIISRPVTTGAIITSATSATGGTTLMTIADLGSVRMRVTIDEVEMANVRVGEHASVAVDAFTDRTFEGVIEKVEPQATVMQGVTFFPVLVNINNKDGLLMPGMNGEVTINAGDLSKVLQIPIDAIRATNELAPVARMFNIPVDTLTNDLRRDLVAGEGTTGIPGRYVVVQLNDSTYEMRLIKVGPTDLRVTEILSGLKEGDKVILLGSIVTGKSAVPPKLMIAEEMKRGAPTTREAQGKGKPTTAATPPAAKAVQAGKASATGKATKP